MCGNVHRSVAEINNDPTNALIPVNRGYPRVGMTTDTAWCAFVIAEDCL
jgi:hypothetical protein